jgi:hypothetical protein
MVHPFCEQLASSLYILLQVFCPNQQVFIGNTEIYEGTVKTDTDIIYHPLLCKPGIQPEAPTTTIIKHTSVGL